MLFAGRRARRFLCVDCYFQRPLPAALYHVQLSNGQSKCPLYKFYTILEWSLIGMLDGTRSEMKTGSSVRNETRLTDFPL